MNSGYRARNFSLNKSELSDEDELVEVVDGPNWWYSGRQQSEFFFFEMIAKSSNRSSTLFKAVGGSFMRTLT